MSISGAQHGLQEITAHISKLVNLKGLTLQRNGAIREVSTALTSLANLTTLCIKNNGGIRIPCNLQVSFLEPSWTLFLVLKSGLQWKGSFQYSEVQMHTTAGLRSKVGMRTE